MTSVLKSFRVLIKSDFMFQFPDSQRPICSPGRFKYLAARPTVHASFAISRNPKQGLFVGWEFNKDVLYANQ